MTRESSEFEFKPKLRIVLVQENEVLSGGLEILLAQDSQSAVIASFNNFSEALALIPKLQPDLVLADWKLAGQTAAEFFSQIRRILPDCKNVVLAAAESQDCVRAALQAGASGFIALLADLSELKVGIRAVAMGRQFVCNSTTTRILTLQLSGNRPVSVSATTASITEREREVLTRIAHGDSNKVIARELASARRQWRNIALI